MAYLIMKLLHVLFAVLFLGNIIVAVLWKIHADKTGDPKIIAHTMRGIIKADRIFTMPGVIGLLIFGFGATGLGRIPILETGWVLWSIILFLVSAAAFMGAVVPTQKKMLSLAESGSFNMSEYQALSSKWTIWGIVAIVTPLIAVILMVLKVPV